MGLPPFEGEEFTENKYRSALKKQLALMHGDATYSRNTGNIQALAGNDWGKEDRIFYPG